MDADVDATEVAERLAAVERSRALALAGVVLFVVSMGASVAMAPTIGAVGSGTERTLVGIQGGGPGWHEHGRVKMYHGREVAWTETRADSYFDVTMTDNGTVLAGFMDGGRKNCGPYSAPCAKTGFQRIDPEAPGGPEVIAEYSFPVRTMKGSEVHDVEALGGGEYLLSDMEHERVFVVRKGEVVWQWNASRFYDAPADPTRTDWLHINDVDVIAEGRYLVSVRNANQLLVIERGKGVVEVINEDTDDSNDGACKGGGDLQDTDGDGDIRCGDPSVLNGQHNPQWLGDGAVLVADSHNDRVVELHRGPDGQWQPAWTLEKAGGVHFNWPRDADRLPNGNTLITDTLNQRVLVVDENGSVVWSIRTKYIPYEADRLPYGELSGGLPRHENGEVTRPTSVPVLSTLLVAARSVWPGLPFWFGELQLFATLLSVALVAGGGADAYRNRE